MHALYIFLSLKHLLALCFLRRVLEKTMAITQVKSVSLIYIIVSIKFKSSHEIFL